MRSVISTRSVYKLKIHWTEKPVYIIPLSVQVYSTLWKQSMVNIKNVNDYNNYT